MKITLKISAMSSVIPEACRANANNTAMRCNNLLFC